MAYPTIAVANTFIRKQKECALKDLTPMKLQKLLFFAQSWHLRKYNEPLFDDFFSRWTYGPVIPFIYHELKKYGKNVIKEPISEYSEEENGDLIKRVLHIPDDAEKAQDIISLVIKIYGKYSGIDLSILTHKKEGAWAQTGGADWGVISNEALKEHFQSLTSWV